MKKIMIWIILLPLLGIGDTISDGSFNSALIDATANWFFHFNLVEFGQTKTGELALAAIPAGRRQRLAAIAELTGADPLTDIASLTLYGPSPEPKQTIAIIKGHFDQSRLVSLLKRDKHYRQYSHGGAIIHRWHDNGESDHYYYGVFADSATVLIGKSRPAVERGLNVFHGSAPNLSIDSRHKLIPEKIFSEAFMLAAIDNLGQLSLQHGRAALLKKTDSMLAYIAEHEEKITLSTMIKASDHDSARLMAQASRGMIALIMLNPESQEAEIGDLLKAVDIEVSEQEFRLTFSYPAEELFPKLRALGKRVNLETLNR